MKNTTNDIETLATAEAVTLVPGNDANLIEQIADAAVVVLTYAGNDDNTLEALTAALPA